MEQNLQHTVSLLSCFPATLSALLRDLPAPWALQDEGENSWSVVEIVGHLIHAEHVDWIPRARMILQFGETRPFEPFDRSAHLRENRSLALGELLDEFARLRLENLAELRALNLTPEDLKRRGRHPALGVVTLSELLATWTVHDFTHLHQISRVLACQYREAVGPWVKFLGVLQCTGHSRSA
jgi:hypothetical protein